MILKNEYQIKIWVIIHLKTKKIIKKKEEKDIIKYKIATTICDICKEKNDEENSIKNGKIEEIKFDFEIKHEKNEEIKYDLNKEIEEKIKQNEIILNHETEIESEHFIDEESELKDSNADEEQDVIGGENEFFKNIKEVNKFIKIFEKLKLTEYINTPRICSIGNQSNGKTSILTNIIGLDILPKGDGVVTRRPLELRLNHIKSGKPYIFFENDINNKITDFSFIKDKIDKLTNSSCGNNKNIKDDPLIINIYSQTCPNLTIIDLPGITRVPVGSQPKNIEEITKEMTLRYINDPYTIILCAIDVNQDISTSDGLYLAKQIDYLGERTLGVLTKVDLMDEGTNCEEILLNKLVPLQLGYIAVKNRSKLDLLNNLSIKEGLEKEKLFFERNEIYNKMDKKLLGTSSLIEKLVEVYTDIFYKNIGDIIDSINQHIRRLNDELKLIGKPIPQTLFEKNIVIQNLIKNYCDTFFNILNNKIDNNEKNYDLISNDERNKIKNLYDNFLIKYLLENNSNIEMESNLNETISFVGLLAPKFKRIENETIFLFKVIVEHLFKLSDRVVHKVFKRFPKTENKISEIIDIIFKDLIKNAKDMIEKVLKYELTYEFTNDNLFLEKYDKEKIVHTNDYALLQNALNDYFKIIIRNIRNAIPKIIQYKLIIYLQNNLFNILIDSLSKNQSIINEFEESINYTKLRISLSRSKTELEKLFKKIRNSNAVSKALLKYNKNERKSQLLVLQKEKRDKLFKKSLEKLKKIRNVKNKAFRVDDIKETLESMCIISSIIKENIIEEKKNNPEKFIPIEEAMEIEDKKNSLFCLGLLAKNLEDQGIMTVIEKEEVKTEEEKELSVATLDFIANGMINKTKFDLHFDFGEERNEQLLLNDYEQNKFKELIKEKISKRFGISKDTLILTDPQRGSFQISFFQNDDFNKLSLNDLKKMGKELYGLKEIQENLIINACKLTKNMLDAKGNRSTGWGIGEKRGGYDYRPPMGWIGYGLNVRGKYDNGNDDWLAYMEIKMNGQLHIIQ